MKRSLRSRILGGLIVVAAILAIGSCSIPGPSSIRIANTSGTSTLAHVTIVLHSSGSWGNTDVLSPGVITPGNTQDFAVNPGFYDVWVTDTVALDAYAFDVQVTAGNTTTLHFDGTATLAE